MVFSRRPYHVKTVDYFLIFFLTGKSSMVYRTFDAGGHPRACLKKYILEFEIFLRYDRDCPEKLSPAV